MRRSVKVIRLYPTEISATKEWVDGTAPAINLAIPSPVVSEICKMPSEAPKNRFISTGQAGDQLRNQ
jgi:hypothetical protein